EKEKHPGHKGESGRRRRLIIRIAEIRMPQGSKRSGTMGDTHNLQHAVIVAGDMTIDWNLARTRRSEGGAAWNSDDCTRAYRQRGGAAMLADLIDGVAGKLRQDGQANCEVRQRGAPREPVQPGDERYHPSYALWSLFKYGITPPLDKEKPAWRVEEFLGLDRTAVNRPSGIDERPALHGTGDVGL